MSYGGDDGGWLLVFILAAIGLISAIGGFIYALCWCFQHVRIV